MTRGPSRPQDVPVYNAGYDAGHAAGRQGGLSQAVTWLQADYPYGDMPEWRQSAVDWLLDRMRDEQIAHADAEQP